MYRVLLMLPALFISAASICIGLYLLGGSVTTPLLITAISLIALGAISLWLLTYAWKHRPYPRKLNLVIVLGYGLLALWGSLDGTQVSPLEILSITMALAIGYVCSWSISRTSKERSSPPS